MEYVLLGILVLGLLGSIYVAFMSSRTWPVYQTVLVVFVFIGALAFFYLGARTLATHKNWRELYRRNQEQARALEGQLLPLVGGVDPQGVGVAGEIPTLKNDLSLAVSARGGGVFYNVKADDWKDGVLQVTLSAPGKLSSQPAVPGAPAEPGAEVPAGEEPAPAEPAAAEPAAEEPAVEEPAAPAAEPAPDAPAAEAPAAEPATEPGAEPAAPPPAEAAPTDPVTAVEQPTEVRTAGQVAEAQPADQPPADQPPADQPPAEQPPAEQPPAEPPADQPVAEPATDQPAEQPAEQPATDQPAGEAQPPAEASPAEPQPAPAEPQPAPAEGAAPAAGDAKAFTHGLVPNTVLFVFDQKALKDGGRYLGEFKVSEAAAASPAIKLTPNLPLTEAQAKRLEGIAGGSLVMYTTMPPDDAAVFAKMAPAARDAMLPPELAQEFAKADRPLRDYHAFFHENYVQRGLLADAISQTTSNIQRIGAAATETAKEAAFREGEKGNLASDLERFQFEVKAIGNYEQTLRQLLGEIRERMKATYVHNRKAAETLTREQLKAADEINRQTNVAAS